MKSFKASLNREVAYGIGFLLLLWASIALLRINDIGIRISIEAMLIIIVWASVFTYGLVKQTYITIDNDKLKYVSFFFQRKTADISDIKIVTTSTVAGFMKFLCIIHYPNGRERLLQISPVGFSKQTLDNFVSELKKINPQIELHKSTEELLIGKSKKTLTHHQIIGLIGTAVSIVLIFVGVFYNKYAQILTLLIPLGGLFVVFSIGYSMRGKLKDAFMWVFYLIIFSLVTALINFLK